MYNNYTWAIHKTEDKNITNAGMLTCKQNFVYIN